jgi:hypothetical protein
VSDLEGDWRVERLSGLLPPMPGVWKRIRGDGGETHLGPLPGVPFQIARREGGFELIYRRPFSTFMDKLQPAPDGSWLGRSTVSGFELGRFRMTRK